MGNYKSSFLNKLISILFAISLVFFIISFSIGIPIYFRPFYYMQIDSLNLEEETGHSKEEIIDAYNEMLDYLTLGKDFGVGAFKYSETGKNHFYDCKILFDLNLTALITSFLILCLITVICKLKSKKLWMPFGFHISFYAAISTLLVFATLGLLISLNFKKAFLIFHKLLFPGKSNWYFNIKTDPIILALPNKFFMNAAIAIISSIIIICLSLVIIAVCRKGKKPFRG